MASPTPSPVPQGMMRLAMVGAAVLVLAGGAAFYFASLKGGKTAAADATVITIKDGACQPNDVTVPAGRAAFRIVNQSDRVMEWEILDGVMVVEERENILPGFTLDLVTKLPAGDFAITCGLLTNPHGALHVTATAAASAEAAKPTLTTFIGPLAEYQVYLITQVAGLTKQVAALDAAIQAADIEQAKTLYAEARLPYARIEAIAKRFGDLDNAINPLADYLTQREADPAFTGFHRIEYGLFAKNSLDGLAPVSTKLVTDVAALKDRIRALRLSPDQLAASAAKLLNTLADTKIIAGEEPYSHADLADFAANLEGVAKVITLLEPVATKAAPDKVADIDAKLKAVQATLADLQSKAGASYASVDAAARTAFATQVKALADSVDGFNASVGLE